MAVYKGELNVEDGDFTLQADRLILRDGEIGFELSGEDGSGRFRVDGTARLQQDGCYRSSSLQISYVDYPLSQDKALLCFEVIALSLQGKVCTVKGRWIQDREAWLFSGKLEKYKVSTLA